MTPPVRVFAAPDGFVRELEHELAADGSSLGGGLFACGRERTAAWAQNTWLAPQIIPITSIGDANKKLREIQRNWSLYPTENVRRARLIEQKLPPIKGKTLAFPAAPPTDALGAWTLLDKDHLLVSPTTDRPFPHGVARFEENKTGPPSRAYLKLWEALTLWGRRPGKNDLCLDLGSSPGGWTWVCAELGARVISVDKAPLAESVSKHPRVTYQQGSAFAIEPGDVRKATWILSDVICYPKRLLRLVQSFLAANVGLNFVCTLKFQGTTDHETAEAFAAIEGGQLVHLSNNKHELTWLYSAKKQTKHQNNV